MIVLLMERVLVVLALGLDYVALTLVKPKKRCGKCSGWGLRAKRRRRRAVACKRCKGTGRQFRPGAVLAHKGVVAARKGIREAVERRREASE